MSIRVQNEETVKVNQLSTRSYPFNALHRGIHETRKRRNTWCGLEDALNQSVQNETIRSSPRVAQHKKSCCSDFKELWCMVTDKWINLLLLAAIPAVGVKVAELGDVMIFTFNFIVMMPLASFLGDMTEIVSSYLGESIGGIVNATLGNAVELIFTFVAIRAREAWIVKSSLLGSFFSNTLLVLGHAMTVAGRKEKRNEVEFNSLGASVSVIMIMVAGFVVTMTSIQKYQKSDEAQYPEEVIWLSRLGAIILIAIYIAYLIFALRTHKNYFVDEHQTASEEQLSLKGSVIALAVVTILVTIFCRFLVDAIDGMCRRTRMTESFLGVVLLPIIANCIEHWTAVICAYRGKMNLALAISLGSAVQIMVFVLPVGVIFGWISEVDVTTSYPLKNVALFLFTIVIVGFLVQQEKANWLYGLLLICVYLLIAVVCWFEKVDDD